MKNKITLIVFITFIYSVSTAQSNYILNSNLLHNMFNDFELPRKQKRTFLKTKSSTVLNKINPLNYISSSLLYLYQNVASEQIQASCQYQISCSENMKNEIKTKGLLFGVLSGLNQLGNCMNNVLDDYPGYKINKDGKINNSIE